MIPLTQPSLRLRAKSSSILGIRPDKPNDCRASPSVIDLIWTPFKSRSGEMGAISPRAVEALTFEGAKSRRLDVWQNGVEYLAAPIARRKATSLKLKKET